MGSTPAWAGKPGQPYAHCSPHTVYPRVGGETSSFRRCLLDARGLPPRGRGNHRYQPRGYGPLRSTPAWAGKPGPALASPGLCPVYPRVGGETADYESSYRLWSGLPPRGRGNRCRVAASANALGSTPAWAGKPLIAAFSRLWQWVYPRVGGETWCAPELL